MDTFTCRLRRTPKETVVSGVRGGLRKVETGLPTEHCIPPPKCLCGGLCWSNIPPSSLPCVCGELGSILSFLKILSLGRCLPTEKTLTEMGTQPQTQCSRAATVHAGDTVWSRMIYGWWVS